MVCFPFVGRLDGIDVRLFAEYAVAVKWTRSGSAMENAVDPLRVSRQSKQTKKTVIQCYHFSLSQETFFCIIFGVIFFLLFGWWFWFALALFTRLNLFCILDALGRAYLNYAIPCVSFNWFGRRKKAADRFNNIFAKHHKHKVPSNYTSQYGVFYSNCKMSAIAYQPKKICSIRINDIPRMHTITQYWTNKWINEWLCSAVLNAKIQF